MKRDLITGMSGVGKVDCHRRAIASRGYDASDLDTPKWSEYGYFDEESPRNWMWKQKPVEELLTSHEGEGSIRIGLRSQ